MLKTVIKLKYKPLILNKPNRGDFGISSKPDVTIKNTCFYKNDIEKETFPMTCITSTFKSLHIISHEQLSYVIEI